MAEPVTLDRHTSAVLIMDFQIRIVNNFASDPQGVLERAVQALHGARQAGIPVLYVVHRGGPFRDEAPGVAPIPNLASATIGLHPDAIAREEIALIDEANRLTFQFANWLFLLSREPRALAWSARSVPRSGP